MQTMTQAEIEREIAELEANHAQHRDWRWTQTKLAGAIGVDRTTVRQYQQRGLPFEREGRTVLFRPSVAMNWWIGYTIIKEKTLKLDASDPLICILLGHALRLNPPQGEPWPIVLHVCCRLAETIGRSRDDVLLVLGMFQGRGIIRQ